MYTRIGNVARALSLGLVMMIGFTSPSAAQKINQIKLTDQHVVGLIEVQDDFVPLAGKLAEANDTPEPALMSKLDETAKKHGFANFEEYRDVDNTIFLVLEGLDRETRNYVPPAERLALELEEIKNDKTIPAADKTAILADVEEELKMAEAVQHPENIEIVIKHLDKLSKLLPEAEDLAQQPSPGAGGQ